MKQINSMCMECGESITNPICPECIVEQAIACLADKHMAGKIVEKELWEINKKLAAIIKANYTDEGVGCISCGNSFAVCPHCVRNAIISEHPKNLKGFFGTARYLKDILPRKLSFYLFYYSLSCFNY